MTTCEHKTSTVQADHGNVQLSECDWGCGAILISITNKDGITRTLTADEAWGHKKEIAKLRRRLQKILDEIHMSFYNTLICECTDEEFEHIVALIREDTE